MPKPNRIASSEWIQQSSQDRLLPLVLGQVEYDSLPLGQGHPMAPHPSSQQAHPSTIWIDREEWQCVPLVPPRHLEVNVR